MFRTEEYHISQTHHLLTSSIILTNISRAMKGASESHPQIYMTQR